MWRNSTLRSGITCRSPRRVMRDNKAHCFEGAMFAAVALERLGHPPVLVDMGAVNDDAHVIALFRRNGRIGAIGTPRELKENWNVPTVDELFVRLARPT